MVAHDTLRDVLLPDFVAASESDTVRESAQLLLEEAMDHLIVVRGTTPVGIVGSRDLLGALLTTADGSTPLETVMHTEFETINPQTPVDEAIERFVGSDQPLLVVENGELFGLVTERDLLSSATPTTAEPSIEPRPGEPSSEQNAQARPQGICEDCGAFTRSLADSNGRSLCADCLEK